MSAAKHTPGPWKLEIIHLSTGRNRHVRASSPSRGVAEVWGPDEDKESDANARLIAAAPELLEALRDIRANCSCCETQPNEPCANCLRCEAAIAKAEGKP